MILKIKRSNDFLEILGISRAARRRKAETRAPPEVRAPACDLALPWALRRQAPRPELCGRRSGVAFLGYY